MTTARERREGRKQQEQAAIAQFKWASKLAGHSWPESEWLAYLKWRASEGKAEDLYCPPPPGVERGKTWSRQLRRMWPNHGRVVIPRFQRGMTQWCREYTSHFWDIDGKIWYFKDRDIAALFKLTFGGN